MDTKKQGRRRFLKEGAALAGMAVGAITSASAQTPGAEASPVPYRDRRAYGRRSRFVNSVRTNDDDATHAAFGRSFNVYTPLQDSIGIITPSSLHWVSAHGYEPPDIDPQEHRLMIHGMVDRPYLGYKEISRYTRDDSRSSWFQFEMGPKSVITFPSGGQRLPSRGYYQITGLAWSGGGAIRRVEVSTDGGRTWKDAEMQEPVLRLAHTRFNIAWKWNGEQTVLLSRFTDELGQVQPSLAEFARFWGATSEQFLSRSARGAGHSNSIQPWGVNRDGSVYNAIS